MSKCPTLALVGCEALRELAPVIEYCRLLSRLVSPADTRRYGLRHDGAVSDFLGGLSCVLAKGEMLDLANNEFDRDLYTRICEDVKHEQ